MLITSYRSSIYYCTLNYNGHTIKTTAGTVLEAMTKALMIAKING